MSGACKLDDTDVVSSALSSLRIASRKELLHLFQSIQGKKSLVLDPLLSETLGLIIEVSTLRELGIEKIHHLLPGKLNTPCQKVIYCVRPDKRAVELITSQIQDKEKSGRLRSDNIEYHVVFVPCRSFVCEQQFERAGVLGEVTLHQHRMDFIPLDSDLFCLELGQHGDDVFQELFSDRTYGPLYYVASALMRLQERLGVFPCLRGKGQCARHISKLLKKLRNEAGDQAYRTAPSPAETGATQMIILDRDVDFVTPLCTQLTYEGLIDEVFGIRNSYVTLDAGMFRKAKGKSADSDGVGDDDGCDEIDDKYSSERSRLTGSGRRSTPNKSLSDGSITPGESPKKRAKTKLILNSNDLYFAAIRDRNFATVSSFLNATAKEVEKNYNERHNAKTLTEIRRFVTKLGNLKHQHSSLSRHTSICEKLMTIATGPGFHMTLGLEQSMLRYGRDYDPHPDILQCIHQNEPLCKVLRLLCLSSLTRKGIESGKLEAYKALLSQTYGFQVLFTLDRLIRAGLLLPSDSQMCIDWTKLCRPLRLFVEDVDEEAQDDIAYVYSGYAPLSVRLIQHLVNHPPLSTHSGWGMEKSDFAEVIRSLPGPTFEETQAPSHKSVTKNGKPPSAPASTSTSLKSSFSAGAVSSSKGSGDQLLPLVLVFVVGGITFTEVSALRWIAQKKGIRILIGSTSLINGDSVIRSLSESFPPLVSSPPMRPAPGPLSPSPSSEEEATPVKRASLHKSHPPTTMASSLSQYAHRSMTSLSRHASQQD